VKRRLNQERLQRLAEIDVDPTPGAANPVSGRVITLLAALPGRKVDVATFLKPWLRSVQLAGIRASVLYAGQCELENARNLYPEVEYIPCSVGTRHLFLERHFPIRDYLTSVSEEYVFVTDGGDVAFRRNPLTLIIPGDERLYLGREEDLIGASRHTLKKMLSAYQDTFYSDRAVFNPGIVGGRRRRVLELLTRLTDEIAHLDCGHVDCDMGIYNKVVHDHYSPSEIVTGHPLHSRFSEWEFDTTAAIMHK
jgi:hypothetical protein